MPSSLLRMPVPEGREIREHTFLREGGSREHSLLSEGEIKEQSLFREGEIKERTFLKGEGSKEAHIFGGEGVRDLLYLRQWRSKGAFTFEGGGNKEACIFLFLFPFVYLFACERTLLFVLIVHAMSCRPTEEEKSDGDHEKLSTSQT